MLRKTKLLYGELRAEILTRPYARRLGLFINGSKFPKFYALTSVGVLLITTFFWSLLGAKLQSSNADQLVNPYLFEHSATLHGALWPAPHNFLIKWPIFYLVKLFGYSSFAFSLLTVLCALVTVSALAAIIYKIERRPLIFGTIMLALASVLLMVPAQPYSGGILPVNMAMITTRNLEYIMFIGGLALIVRSLRLRSWQFWAGVLTLGLLAASDRLFLSLSVCGALLALVAYALSSGWRMVGLAARWLVGSASAAVTALLVLWLINYSGFTKIIAQGSAGPFGLVHNLKHLATGFIYGLAGLFTNFGANPAYASLEIRHIPDQIVHGLASIGGFSYLINSSILVVGAFFAYKLIRSSLKNPEYSSTDLDSPTRLAALLIWSTLAAFGLFVLTDHYYAVDARYLTVALFGIFIALAASTRRKRWQPNQIVAVGAVLVVSILLAIPAATKAHNTQRAALSDINHRNQLVAQILAHHTVDVLVGDYWRVLPIKQGVQDDLTVLPLQNCSQPRDISISNAWRLDLHKHSFAYLLSTDGSLTGYRNCDLGQIINLYGRPNTSVIVAGTQSQPTEILLFYDKGILNSMSAVTTKIPGTILPIPLNQLPYANCPNGVTIMNIVAHQDDDLLFMNPDILHAIKAGSCIRTIYMTAGDAGGGYFYWLSRERGSEAAYSYMIGSKEIWVQRIAQLGTNEFAMVAHPQSDYRVSLIFMRLPDGNLQGQGFLASYFESLAKLQAGKIKQIHSVDSQSTYTLSQLTSALAALMNTYGPAETWAQTPTNLSGKYPDHSDHITVGQLTQKATQLYVNQQFEGHASQPLRFYTGYPIRAKPPNVNGQDLVQKEATFSAYAHFDPGVCQNDTGCGKASVYSFYLSRQYQYAP